MVDQIRRYYDDVSSRTPGEYGLHEQISYPALMDRFQKAHDIRGSIAEIGLLGGIYFNACAVCARPDEIGVGVDLFEDQTANIDGSGRHDLTIKVFEEDWERRITNGARAKFIKGDSLYLTPARMLEASEGQLYRIVSIDGGHTHYHLVNDVLLMQDVLCHGGVMVIDDYTNPGWPGVAEGVARYFLLNTKRLLAPIFCHWNKLILTTESFHGQYINFITDFAEQNEIKLLKQRLYGFDVIHAQDFHQALFR